MTSFLYSTYPPLQVTYPSNGYFITSSKIKHLHLPVAKKTEWPWLFNKFNESIVWLLIVVKPDG
jgi:hypothetical protein